MAGGSQEGLGEPAPTQLSGEDSWRDWHFQREKNTPPQMDGSSLTTRSRGMGACGQRIERGSGAMRASKVRSWALCEPQDLCHGNHPSNWGLG